MTVVMLVTLILMAHKFSGGGGISRKVKIKQHISGAAVFGKEKLRATHFKRRPSRPARGARFVQGNGCRERISIGRMPMSRRGASNDL